MTGHDLTRDFEELKLSLVRLRPDDLEASRSEAIRNEIGAIRRQLRRLERDRLASAEAVRRIQQGRRIPVGP